VQIKAIYDRNVFPEMKSCHTVLAMDEKDPKILADLSLK
jgi:hypothetical protein